MKKDDYFLHLRFDELTDHENQLIPVKTAIIKFLFDRGFYFDVENSIDTLLDDFTFDNIVYVWSNQKHHLLDEKKLTLTINQRTMIKDVIFSSLDISDENSSIIGQVYEKTLGKSLRQSKGIAYTPESIYEYMTDKARRDIELDSTMLDPSCGCGVFLSCFYDALMEKAFLSSPSSSIEATHRRILHSCIYGMDVSADAVCISKLILALKFKTCVITDNVIIANAIEDTDPFKGIAFDYILMNPPYLGHKKITKDSMARLKERYTEVFHDKADLSYCFFSYAKDHLKEGGKLFTVCPRYISQSLYADRLRHFILNSFTIMHIVDFYGIRPFKNLGIDPMLLFLKKGYTRGNLFTVIKLDSKTNTENFRFDDLTNNLIRQDQDELDPKGFNFLSDTQKDIQRSIEDRCSLKLDDILTFFQGAISGCDRAYVITDKDEDYELVRDECMVKWIKNSDVKDGKISFKDRYLLYVSDVDTNLIPNTMRRLENFKDTLEKRREVLNSSRRWYEMTWPRKRELFEEPKIVFPYKASTNRFMYDDKGYFFSADIYGCYPKKGFGNLDLEKLVMLLDSKLYEDYFHSFAKKLGNDLYEYYPNTVKNILIPDVDVINSFETVDDVETYFFS